MTNSLIFLFISLITLSSYNTKFLEKIPEYLSIETDTKISHSLVFDYIKTSFEKIIELNGEGESLPIFRDYIDIFGKFLKIFHPPNSWHTTCLYIGEDYTKLESNIYKKFVEGIKINILASTFIYVPGKIILSPVFFDNFSLIENKYPHMTMMVGEYQAVDSNYVMESIFGHDDELRDLYNTGKIKDENFHLFKKLKNVKIHFDRDGSDRIAEEVYILKYGGFVLLDGITKKNFLKK